MKEQHRAGCARLAVNWILWFPFTRPVRGFPPNFDPQYLLESGNSWFILPIRIHEIAHYFGIDDGHLDDIGWG